MRNVDREKLLRKKLLENAASRHDLWEGGGVSLDNLEEYDEQLRAEKEKLMQELEFLKEVPRDKVGRFVEARPGWYQDNIGNLYKYDGIIWNPIPENRIQDLEYLSGE